MNFDDHNHRHNDLTDYSRVMAWHSTQEMQRQHMHDDYKSMQQSHNETFDFMGLNTIFKWFYGK